MVIDGLPNNLLKLISGEGLSDVLPSLIKYLKPGMLLEGTVLKSFPDKNKAVVLFEKRQVIVETRQPLTPGHSFAARVEKTTPQPVLKIIASGTQQVPVTSQFETNAKTHTKQRSDVTSLKTKYQEPVPRELTPSDIKSLKLTIGQSVEAQITHLSGRSTAIATIRDKEVMVHFKTLIAPAPGETVKLSVERYKQNFRLVTKDGGDLARLVEVGKIKPLLSAKEPFGEMVQKIDSLLMSSPLLKNINTETALIARLIKTIKLLKPEIVPDSVLLKEQVENSGINYEARVKKIFSGKSSFQIPQEISRDLKGQLLELNNAIENIGKQKEISPDQLRYLTEAVKTIRRAIDNIELQQLTNQFARQENQPIVLQIPNPFFGDKKSIKLYLRKSDDESDNRGGVKKDGVLLVFLLDLSALGNLRVDARLNKEIVSVRINVENQTIAQFIDTNLGGIHSRLTNLGFQCEITCCVTKNVDQEFEKELNQLLVNHCENLVDLTT